MFSEKVIEIRQ